MDGAMPASAPMRHLWERSHEGKTVSQVTVNGLKHNRYFHGRVVLTGRRADTTLSVWERSHRVRRMGRANASEVRADLGRVWEPVGVRPDQPPLAAPTSSRSRGCSPGVSRGCSSGVSTGRMIASWAMGAGGLIAWCARRVAR
jgi:hypothetical protein